MAARLVRLAALAFAGVCAASAAAPEGRAAAAPREDGESALRPRHRMRYHRSTAQSEADSSFAVDSVPPEQVPRHRVRICNAHPRGDMLVKMVRSNKNIARHKALKKRIARDSEASLLRINTVPVSADDEEEEDETEDETPVVVKDSEDEDDEKRSLAREDVSETVAVHQKRHGLAVKRDTPGFEESLRPLGEIPRKTCREFITPVGVGDYFRFEIADSSAAGGRRAGVYLPDDPDGDEGRVLIVAYTRDASHEAIEIKVHFFKRMYMPRIAAVNVVPPGPDMDVAGGEVRITRLDRDSDEATFVNYDTVSALEAGWHRVELLDADGKSLASTDLRAEHGEGYVAMRLATDEVVVFPAPAPYPTYKAWLAAKEAAASDRDSDRDGAAAAPRSARSAAPPRGLAAALALALLAWAR